jgi:hypothetical protein
MALSRSALMRVPHSSSPMNSLYLRPPTICLLLYSTQPMSASLKLLSLANITVNRMAKRLEEHGEYAQEGSIAM